VPTKSVRFLTNVGEIFHTLELPEGAIFEAETIDLTCLDMPPSGIKWVSRLEKRWDTTLGLVLISAFLLILTYRFLIPIAAERITASLPPSVAEKIATETEREIENSTFVSASKLSEVSAARVHRVFARMQLSFPGRKLILVLRHGESMGTNAFALPDGTIYVTDQIAEILSNDDQLLAVLFHEVGHVVKNHGLRSEIESFGIGMFTRVLGNDVNGKALPESLLTSGYSRKFESEADLFSANELRKIGLRPVILADALKNIETGHGGPSGGAFDFLSDHPSTGDRIQQLRGKDLE
jgi:Zn-dependent protease with chaperone function